MSSKAKTQKRTAKSGGKRKKNTKVKAVEPEPDEKWRDNVRQKLSTLVDDEKLGSEIEAALYQKTLDKSSQTDLAVLEMSIFKHRYLYHLQTLVLNLDPEEYVGNKNLIIRVKNHEVSPVELVVMTPEEMFPEKWEEIRKKQKEEEKFLYENHRKATSKRIKCFACGERQVCTTEQQTRSADEPMTVFYECLNCNNRWRS